MRTASTYIILLSAAMVCLSCWYFFSILFSLPLIVTSLLTGSSLVFLYIWLLRKPVAGVYGSWLSFAALVGLLAVIALRIPPTGVKYGNSDAYTIWNFHAKYLVDPVNWKKMFQNTDYCHPDYPLCVPSINAFFMRLLNTNTVLPPFVLCVSVMLSIPYIIFMEVSRKNVIVALLACMVFVLEHFYGHAALSQYADIILAWFFLCAFVCASYSQGDKRYIALTAFFLAACAWTKNEGVVLAAIFMVYYARTFFIPRNIGYTFAGLLLPLLALSIFKMQCTVPNDMVQESGGGILHYLTDASRYAMIFGSYRQLITDKFAYTTAAIVLLVILSAIAKKRPGRDLYILLTCLVVYSFIYVVTPKDLAWHLRTSHERLVLQLMPATIFVLATMAADFRIPVPPSLKKYKVFQVNKTQ